MNALRITAFLVVVTFSTSSVLQTPENKDTFELLILHNNDMHARFEQTSQLSGTCTTKDREEGKCYGGFPRVAHVVKEARQAAASGEGPPVLYLNAGDTYTGTAWFTIYKWKIAAEFLNALKPDAVSLGNSDLYTGSSDPLQLLNNIDTSIVVTNIINHHKDLEKNILKSLVFDIKGRKVGLVGYLTPEPHVLNNPGDIEYIDEIIALKEEVEKLKSFNIDIILALGRSDSNKDKEIAREIEGIDLIISSYNGKVYTNGANAETELPKEIKPYTVTQASGKIVPVIPSFSYDKYLGNFKVLFDGNGDIVNFESNPILLDDSTPEDIETANIIKTFSSDISRTFNEVVGRTAVQLDGASCKTEECNMGNLITDAMAYYHALQYDGVWTDAPIAIIHAGAIGSSIELTTRPSDVTRGDLFQVLPTNTLLVAVTLNGTTLKQVLEQSAEYYNEDQFLQYSGIRVIYNLHHETGSKVVNAVVRSSGFVPEFYSINDSSNYTALMTETMANSEEYPMLHGLPKTLLTYDGLTCLDHYIRRPTPVYPEIADRVIFINGATAITSTITIILLAALTPLFN